MNDSVKGRGAPAFDDRIELTQTLRRLSVPLEPSDGDTCGVKAPVLLLSRDKDARKWGQRWLSREGLQVNFPDQPADGLAIARETQPGVIVVDAALRDASGVPLYSVLADAADVARERRADRREVRGDGELRHEEDRVARVWRVAIGRRHRDPQSPQRDQTDRRARTISVQHVLLLLVRRAAASYHRAHAFRRHRRVPAIERRERSTITPADPARPNPSRPPRPGGPT